MGYIHIRNWDEHQHRDVTRNKRDPARWIKEKAAQLNDEEYIQLGWADRGLLHSLRLQYMANRGRGINESTTNLHRLFGHRVLSVQLKRLSDAGFIEILDSKLLEDCQQHASLEESRQETPVVPLEVEPPKQAEDVRAIYENWKAKTGHRRSRLTNDRRRKIVARLREGYTVEDLLLVPDGANADSWDKRYLHNDIGVLYRDAQHVDKFLALARGEANANGAGHTEQTRELLLRLGQQP